MSEIKFDKILSILIIPTFLFITPIGKFLILFAYFFPPLLIVVVIGLLLPNIVFFMILNTMCFHFFSIIGFTINRYHASFFAIILLIVFTIFINFQTYLDISRIKKTSLPDFQMNNYTELGILNTHRRSKPFTCDSVCQRLLLTESVERVHVLNQDYFDSSDLGSLRSTAFRLAENEICPDFEPRSITKTSYDKKLENSDERYSVSDILQIFHGSGRCFLREEANFDNADAIIAYGDFSKSEKADADHFSGNRRIKAKFVELYEKNQSEFIRKYRSISGQAKIVFPIIFIDQDANDYAWSFFRIKYEFGEFEFDHESYPPNIFEFLVDEFGYDLNLSSVDFSNKIRRYLRQFFESDEEPSDVVILLSKLFFENLKDGVVSKESYEFLISIIEDDRLIDFDDYDHLSRTYFVEDTEYTRRYARYLFGKLRSFQPDMTQDLEFSKYAELHAISRALSRLPAGALKSDFSAFKHLAETPEFRPFADDMLARLDVFGERGLNVLLYLVEQNYRLRKQGLNDKRQQGLYRSVLRGLCYYFNNEDHSISEEKKQLIDQMIESDRFLLDIEFSPYTAHLFSKIGYEFDYLVNQYGLVDTGRYEDCLLSSVRKRRPIGK